MSEKKESKFPDLKSLLPDKKEEKAEEKVEDKKEEAKEEQPKAQEAAVVPSVNPVVHSTGIGFLDRARAKARKNKK